MPKYKLSSFLVQIVLFIIFIGLAMGALSIAYFNHFSSITQNLVQNSYADHKENIANTISSLIFERAVDAQAFAKYFEGKKLNDKSNFKDLTRLVELYTNYSQLYLLDKNGKVLAMNKIEGIKNSSLIGADFSRRRWFVESKNSLELKRNSNSVLDKTFISGILEDDEYSLITGKDERSIYITTEIITADRTMGYIHARSRVDWIESAFEEQLRRMKNVGLARSFFQLANDDQILIEVGNRNLKVLGHDIDYISVFKNDDFGYLKWKLGLYTPEDDILKIIRSKKSQLITYFLMFLIVSSGVAFVFGTRFNEIYDKLQEVTKLRNKLDLLVAERTLELEKTVKELELARERMISQDKMASVGELSAGLAHEIKNPLNFIINSSKIITYSCDDLIKSPEKFEKLSTRIKDASDLVIKHSERIDSLVKSILLSSKGVENEEERSVSVKGVIEMSWSLASKIYKNDLPSNFKFELIEDYLSDKVLARESELLRVFINVFDNALYSITQKFQKINGTPVINVFIRQVGDSLIIRVRDNGLGLDEKISKLIFTPFYTTKPVEDGSGLGLSIVNDILRRYGGIVTVDGKLEEFAEFTIELPLLEKIS